MDRLLLGFVLCQSHIVAAVPSVVICDWLHLSDLDYRTEEYVQNLTVRGGLPADTDFSSMVVVNEEALLPLCVALANRLVSVFNVLGPVIDAYNLVQNAQDDGSDDAAVGVLQADLMAKVLAVGPDGCSNLDTLVKGTGEVEQVVDDGDGISTLLTQVHGLLAGYDLDCGTGSGSCEELLQKITDLQSDFANLSPCLYGSLEASTCQGTVDNYLTQCVYAVALPNGVASLPEVLDDPEQG